MSRKYIEARRSFSGLTSEQLSSEEEIDMRDHRITLTWKPPVGEKSQIDSSPPSSSGKHYLSLCLANHESRDTMGSEVDQCKGDELPGYASEAVHQRELVVPSAIQIQVNPFAYQALDTPVRPDQGALAVCERDLAKNCGLGKETPITGDLLGSENDECCHRVESDFLAINPPPSDDSQSVNEETGPSLEGQGLPSEERAGSVTEYCFLDMKSVTTTDDPCPMLFGQKLSRIPVAEVSDKKKDPPRRTEENTDTKQHLPSRTEENSDKKQDLLRLAEDNTQGLAVNTDSSKEPYSGPEEPVPPPVPSVVGNPEMDRSDEAKQSLALDQQILSKEAEATPNPDKAVREQADSGAVKRVGRIIKMPASVVGSGPLEFDDRSGSPWNSRKRLHTAYDRASAERDYARTKPSREPVFGSDGEDERHSRSRRYKREEEFPRHGRRITTAQECSPRRPQDRNDMYNLKISTSGHNRNVFNRKAGPPHKETVFNRLNYGEYDDSMIVERDYKNRREVRYREDGYGPGRFPRRGMYSGSSSKDNDHFGHRIRSGAYYRRSPERDYSRSPDKMKFPYTQSLSETQAPTLDLETSDTFRPSKNSGWDRNEGNREPERLASYVPFADRMNGRSSSPDGYIADRSRKMRFDSPSEQPPARIPREQSASIYDERVNQRAPSHHSVGRPPENWEPLPGYKTFEPKQKKPRPMQTYSDEETSGAEPQASGGLKHELFDSKASLQDFLGSGKSHSSTSNALNNQSVVIGEKEHLDMHETNGDTELVDYLGEFVCERQNVKFGVQARDKEQTSIALQNGFLGSVRSSEDTGPSEVCDLNFAISHPENFSATRNIRGRLDHYLSWEERDSRHTSAGSREIPSNDVWPEDRLELSINRYREKVCY